MKWNFLRMLISSLMHGCVKAKVSPCILSLPCQHWNYRQVLLHPGFQQILAIRSHILCLHRKLFSIESLFQSGVKHFFIVKMKISFQFKNIIEFCYFTVFLFSIVQNDFDNKVSDLQAKMICYFSFKVPNNYCCFFK